MRHLHFSILSLAFLQPSRVKSRKSTTKVQPACHRLNNLNLVGCHSNLKHGAVSPLATKKGGFTFPHPRVESVDGDVHGVSLAERPQPVEDAALVGELEVLQEAQVHVEQHQLISAEKRESKMGEIR